MATLGEQTRQVIFTHERERFGRALLRIRDEVKFQAPIDSGDTFRSIQVVEVTVASDTLLQGSLVATTPQAKWTDEGTGLFGPLGRLIRPTTARYLAWFRDGEQHFERYVAGQDKHKGWFTDTVKRVWVEVLRKSAV